MAQSRRSKSYSKKTKSDKVLSSFIKKIGPTNNWVGQCFGIASEAVRHKLVPKGSVAVYGHWLGPIHDDSIFGGRSFTQHGWVNLPDGTICDPTRWVFEHVAPYIYFGPSDHYDEGGNQIRSGLLGDAPRYNLNEKQFEITKRMLPTSAWHFIEEILDLVNTPEIPIGVICARQLHWIANQPPSVLGNYALPIYEMLDGMKLRALVPYDNWHMVTRASKK